MHKILFTDTVSDDVLANLEKETDVTFDIVPAPSQEHFAEIIGQYDGVVVRSSVKVDATVLKAGGQKLKVVVRAGVGVDNVDIPAATENGVLVVNTPDAITYTTAEHTIGLMLALARHIPQAYASMQRGEWGRKKYTGVEVADKTLGLVGLGRIGQHVAKVCLALGMRVIAYDPYLPPAVAEQLGVQLVSFETVIAESDFISLHAVLNNETRNMINADVLAQMKDGVRLINTARGALIDEAALAEALQNGKVAGAALDTFSKEPLATESPFRSLPNVITTPHLAASTDEAQFRAGTLAVAKMLAALRGGEYGQPLNQPTPKA